MSDDAVLLRRYVSQTDEVAFRQLVERHLPMTYSCALRQVGGDRALAEDVAQSVFVDLARQANSFENGFVVSGWLYRAARFAAAKAVRTEQRRRHRDTAFAEEMEFADSEMTMVEQKFESESVGFHLDAAIGELSDQDRDAIVLRFFEQLDFQAVGAALKISDDAAQKRVSRALGKLRTLLTERGVTLPVAVLAASLAETAKAMPPSGLAENIAREVGAAAAASSGGATVSSSKALVIAKAAVAAAALICGPLLVAYYLPQKSPDPSTIPGLVSWWTGNGDSLDAAGRNHAVVEGNVTYVPGIHGTCFHFDGFEGTRLLIPDSPSLNLTNEITVECWVRPDEDSIMGSLIVKRTDDRTEVRNGNFINYGLQFSSVDTFPQWGICLYYNDITVRGGYHLCQSLGGTNYYFVSRRDLLEQLAFFPSSRQDLSGLRGQWHHLAGTYKQLSDEKIAMAIFFDGECHGRIVLPGSLARCVSSAPLLIGGYPSVCFKGSMDEIRIYNRTLSDQEIISAASIKVQERKDLPSSHAAGQGSFLSPQPRPYSAEAEPQLCPLAAAT